MANYTCSTIIVLAADRLKAQAVSSDQCFNTEASADGLAPATPSVVLTGDPVL